MEKLFIVKVGGNVIDDPSDLLAFLKNFASLQGKKILVHGGGKKASEMSRRLGIEPVMVEGRRITDKETLEIVTMVYGGLINKNIVAMLQSTGCNAIGISGADGNIIPGKKRNDPSIDYGFAGDISPESINVIILKQLIEAELVPVIAPLSCSPDGTLLNTNADTIASTLSVALSELYDVHLVYCFEKEGVLMDKSDERSVIDYLPRSLYPSLKKSGVVADGMIPKLDNAFEAITKGVNRISIAKAEKVLDIAAGKTAGTLLTAE